MGKTWVQLKQGMRLERRGEPRSYNVGDWVQVGKQLALLWINTGVAEIPDMKIGEFSNESDIGILVVDNPNVGLGLLKGAKISVGTGDPELRWTRTLLWSPSVVLRKENLAVGFHLLDTWQVACPLLDYEQLARGCGSPKDKERTETLIGDLRVPLYDYRLVFIKRCEDTQYLMGCWDEERIDSENPYHSFLRAIYRAKPLILALPPNWSNPNYRSAADDW